MTVTENDALQFIEENDVKFIKLFFTDIFGSIKSIAIQPNELKRAFAEGISFDASMVKGFLNTKTSDLFIVPDPATLCVLPWRPQKGRVVRFYCNIRYIDGTPFEGDTRHLLSKIIANVAKKGFECKIGTECEFYLFNRDEKGNPTREPYDHATYCDLAPADKGENVRREICLTLEKMGISPEMSHHETGPGQNEIDFKYSSAFSAADNLETFKNIVRTIATQNGLFASFFPKPLENESGSGLHINISLYKDGKNLFDNKIEDFSDEAKSFIAGILNRIPEMTAFLNPTENSYKRLGCFEAPKYINWSRENRNQLVRIPAAKGESSRIELRSPDPSCNPYLALALILAAGFEGIETKAKLQKEGEATGELPSTLKEASGLATKSDFIKKVIPEVTIKAFVDAEEIRTNPNFERV